MKGQWAEIDWRDDGVPVSIKFDDPYFSRQHGLAETRHVFLAGNGLPHRFRPGFHIAELGFGTGLNLLAAWHAWRQSGQAGVLNFTSFEAYPMARTDMARALAEFPEIADLAAEFLDAFGGVDRPVSLPGLDAIVLGGDARSTVPGWSGRADAWFLDGFAPARNPELWQPALIQEVAGHTAPGGTAATYSAAGQVRAALADAGFTVERVAGFGRKRHMTRAVLGELPDQSSRPRR